MSTSDDPVICVYYTHVKLDGLNDAQSFNMINPDTKEPIRFPEYRGLSKSALKRRANQKNEYPYFDWKSVINEAYGFEDGSCNYIAEDGKITPKPMDESQSLKLTEAHHSLRRSIDIKVEVSVYKSGNRTIKLVD